MTNSRLTDPEVLESRFPVTLESFAIRRGSGGDGRYRGGDGVVRRVRFHQSMQLSLLTGHRKIAPYGMQGGLPGLTGVNVLLKAGGQSVTLGSTDSVQLSPGDAIEISTPGGGGFGQPLPAKT